MGIVIAFKIPRKGESMKTIQIISFIGSTLLLSIAFGQESISLSRKPANFVQDEEQSAIPVAQELWINSTFKEDNEGVLASMRNDVKSWEERETFVKSWNLRATGLYSVTSEEEREASIKKRFLKYADKRLSGELKGADKDSTLGQVATVQKALKPSSTLAVSEDYKVKFQAKVLQGQATVRLINPYFEYDTNFSLSGSVNMHVGKEIKEMGVRTDLNLDIGASRYVASVDKDLGNNFAARASTSQATDESVTSSAADKKIELMYNLPF